MLVETIIFFGLYSGGKQLKDQYGTDAETQEKSREREQHAARDAKGVTGALKGRNLAKKIGGGADMQKIGAGIGAGFGALKGSRKGKKEANEREEEGKKPHTSRTRALAKEGAKEGAKYLIDQKAKQIAFANAADTFGASVVLYYGIKHWKVTIVLLGSIILFLFLLFDGNGSFNPPKTDNGQTATPTTSDICNPATAAKGQTSVCSITVTYDGSAQDIIITDTILPGTEYVSSNNNGTYTPPVNTVGKDFTQSSPGTVTWDAGQLGLPLDPVNITVSVTVRVTTDTQNTIVYNAYSINPEGLSAGAGGGAACTATGSPNAEAAWNKVLTLGKQYGPLWITFLNDARAVAQQQDYPLAVIVGQGALESAHGTSNFAKTRNNFFGFNADTNDPNNASSYPNPEASILAYVKLIKGGNGGGNQLYLQAYASRADPVKMVELIKAGGYATDPNYVSEVTGIQEFQILSGITLPCN